MSEILDADGKRAFSDTEKEKLELILRYEQLTLHQAGQIINLWTFLTALVNDFHAGSFTFSGDALEVYRDEKKWGRFSLDDKARVVFTVSQNPEEDWKKEEEERKKNDN